MNLTAHTSSNTPGRFSETGSGRSIRYHFKPDEKVHAVFDGNKARCGNCNSMLGEFKSADGEIKCRKNDCKVINIIKK